MGWDCEGEKQKVEFFDSRMSQFNSSSSQSRSETQFFSWDIFKTFFTLSAFISGENLKILKLKKMDIQSETINGILKKCLGLEKSNGFDVLKIKNPNLKFSELKWLIVEEIDIYTEDL